MFWNDLSFEEKNKIILKLLIRVSTSDLHLQDEEVSYLTYFCKLANINTELIQTYKESTSLEEEVSLPTSEQDRMNILYHLLFVTNADSNVTSDEERAIYKMAFQLGFNENITRDFIELMKLYSIQSIPKDAMIEIIRKYSN